MCPVCNGILVETKACPKCGGEMTNIGKVTDFFGPYSPYMEFDSFLQMKKTSCLHVYSCVDCSFQDTVEINKIEA
ncbi:hypothetical protein HOO54_07450 [Bacillus sp. WMMC1349]|uniref:hypothetical protein n=1 Tax=Bacillus sp. WMMC1349 TaxID=2736254 RepID=UPI00155770EC|nr:hypothetical protein [Bacillus sp. WMMC1349]NPC92052.1 hypothetical protein [Bacillus sp. WMMC1349]